MDEINRTYLQEHISVQLFTSTRHQIYNFPPILAVYLLEPGLVDTRPDELTEWNVECVPC